MCNTGGAKGVLNVKGTGSRGSEVRDKVKDQGNGPRSLEGGKGELTFFFAWAAERCIVNYFLARCDPSRGERRTVCRKDINRH